RRLAERVRVHDHAPRLLLAREVELKHGHVQRDLLKREGLVGERLDLHRPAVAPLGVVLDYDAGERVIPSDELPAQVTEPNSFLSHYLTPLRAIPVAPRCRKSVRLSN